MVTSSEGIGVESTENFSLATARELSATGPDILGRFAFIHLLSSHTWVTGSTIFAPSNEAFNRTAKILGGEAQLEELLKSQKDAPSILGLHIIDEQIPSNDIRITKPQNFVTCKTCKVKVIFKSTLVILLR